MMKIDMKQQHSKKHFNFKKILRISLVLALVLIFIGVVFALLPEEQSQQQPIIQAPTEHYNVTMFLFIFISLELLYLS